MRFSGGRVPGKNGFEETELAAIVDIQAGKLIAIEPHRQGARVSTWTWDGDQLQVASVDGVTDQYQLRPPTVAVVGQRGSRPYSSAQTGQPWAPWNPFGGQQPPRSEKSQRRYKPKSIFDLLFGN